jgi:hypothetical protein
VVIRVLLVFVNAWCSLTDATIIDGATWRRLRVGLEASSAAHDYDPVGWVFWVPG